MHSLDKVLAKTYEKLNYWVGHRVLAGLTRDKDLLIRQIWDGGMSKECYIKKT